MPKIGSCASVARNRQNIAAALRHLGKPGQVGRPLAVGLRLQIFASSPTEALFLDAR
jgi:hypothetical protein